MQIQDIIQAEAINASGKATSKKRLFRLLAEMGEALTDIDADDISLALNEREDLGSTGMGKGVAIPHARIDGIQSVQGVFIRLDEPVDFQSFDHENVDLVFALLAPKTGGTDHLKALAKISRIMRDPDIRNKLRSTQDADAIFAILSEEVNLFAA